MRSMKMPQPTTIPKVIATFFMASFLLIRKHSMFPVLRSRIAKTLAPPPVMLPVASLADLRISDVRYPENHGPEAGRKKFLARMDV